MALDEALAQLDEQTAAAEQAQAQIRTQAREVANLKVRTLLLRQLALADFSPRRSSRPWKMSPRTRTRFSPRSLR